MIALCLCLNLLNSRGKAATSWIKRGTSRSKGWMKMGWERKLGWRQASGQKQRNDTVKFVGKRRRWPREEEGWESFQDEKLRKPR